MQIVTLNKTTLTSLFNSDLGVSADGKETYKLKMTADLFQENELLLLESLAKTFGVTPEHYGVLGIKDTQVERFEYPVIVKNSEGIVGLQLGSEFIPYLLVGEKTVTMKGKEKQVPIWTLNGVEVFFGEFTFKNPKNPSEDIKAPIMIVEAENDLIFHVQLRVNQKPYDVEKVKEGEEYYNHTAFTRAVADYDEDAVNAAIRGNYEFGKSINIGKLFSDSFRAGKFPPDGICIPVSGFSKVPSTNPKYKDSAALTVDLTKAWFTASGNLLPVFTVSVKRAGVETPAQTDDITGLYVAANHTAYKNAIAFLASNKIPTEDSPWILWITAPNSNGEFDHVPEHGLYSLETASRIKKIAAHMPLALTAAAE